MRKCGKTALKDCFPLQEEFDDYGCHAYQSSSRQKGHEKCSNADLPCFSNQFGHFGPQLFVHKFNFRIGHVVHAHDCLRLRLVHKPEELKANSPALRGRWHLDMPSQGLLKAACERRTAISMIAGVLTLVLVMPYPFW